VTTCNSPRVFDLIIFFFFFLLHFVLRSRRCRWLHGGVFGCYVLLSRFVILVVVVVVVPDDSVGTFLPCRKIPAAGFPGGLLHCALYSPSTPKDIRFNIISVSKVPNFSVTDTTAPKRIADDADCRTRRFIYLQR